jgi:hypothetical protein
VRRDIGFIYKRSQCKRDRTAKVILLSGNIPSRQGFLKTCLNVLAVFLGSSFSRLLRKNQKDNSFSNLKIPIHHKCHNCGQRCDQSNPSNTCIYATYTRTGTKEQPLIIRPVVPTIKYSGYHHVEFTSHKILTSTNNGRVCTDKQDR